MRQISCHAGCVDNIVEGELVDERRGFEEEGQRLETTSALEVQSM